MLQLTEVLCYSSFGQAFQCNVDKIDLEAEERIQRRVQDGLHLSERQKEKFRYLRQTVLSKMSHLSLAQSCVSDFIRDILGSSPPPEAPADVETNLDLLNTGEHPPKNKPIATESSIATVN